MDELESLINSQFFNTHLKEFEYEVKTEHMELESIKLKEVELEIELKDIKMEETNRKVRHKFGQFCVMSIVHLLSTIVSKQHI